MQCLYRDSVGKYELSEKLPRKMFNLPGKEVDDKTFQGIITLKNYTIPLDIIVA